MNFRTKFNAGRTQFIKDKCFSIIAHDLRNPFNSLMITGDILRNKYDELSREKILYLVEIIYSASKDGYDLLVNLLEWNRTQRNQLEFNTVQTDNKKTIDGNLQLLSSMVAYIKFG